MKSRLTFIGLFILLLISGICFFRLYSHFRLNGTKIAALQQQSAELGSVRAQNKALQRISRQFEELEDLRKDNEERFRIRNEIRQLQAAAEKRKLDLARILSGLQAENLRIRDEIGHLEQAPEAISARQLVDVNELTQIGQALNLYANMNSNTLPENLAELKYYTAADAFPALEINRFEILYKGKLTDIADPSKTPLIRARFRNPQNQRPCLFADEHLEMEEE
ncbi:MAG: hypothetical protein JWR26_2773 [Pedosphaera sp.]|nr:hypothetical protein [Pedosphaera sp.]